MRFLFFFAALFFLAFPVLAAPPIAAQVTALTCEYRNNPIGVATDIPHFGWQLSTTQKNSLQYAFRILVADDIALLAKDMGNVWDSKKVASAASVQVAYAGTALTANKKYYWKVM